MRPSKPKRELLLKMDSPHEAWLVKACPPPHLVKSKIQKGVKIEKRVDALRAERVKIEKGAVKRAQSRPAVADLASG